jgi:hypothetical protein
MKKIFIPALALAVLAPSVVVAEAAPQRFTHEGKSYSYTVEERGDYRLIRGVEENSRKPFVLRVGESRVRGTMGNNNVSFHLNKVKPLVADSKAKSTVAAL